MESDRAAIDWRPFGWSIPRLLLIGLVGCLCLVFFVAASTSTAGFSLYNSDWDGNHEFREIASATGELTIATNVSQYQEVDPSSRVAFVFAPETAYTTSEAATVQQFVANGGTLVVADNYGTHGNTLLDKVGANARFDGGILRDNRNNFRSSSTPIVAATGSHPLVSNIESLTLNYGTAIKPNGAQPLINSSEYSYLAATENETLSDADQLQQYPVATTEAVGEGQVIAIGDPSLFINAMIEKSDNRQFATNLVEQQSRTVVDISHTNSVPPLIQAVLTLRSVPLLAAGVLTVLIVVVATVSAPNENKSQSIRKRLRKTVHSLIRSDETTAATAIASGQGKADREALKRRLQERHPEWEDERLEAVIAGVLSHDQRGMKDE